MKHFVKILGKSFTLLVLLANELFLPFSFSNDLSSDLLELPQDVSLIDEVLENQENSILGKVDSGNIELPKDFSEDLGLVSVETGNNATLTSGSDEEIDSVVETGNNVTLTSGSDERIDFVVETGNNVTLTSGSDEEIDSVVETGNNVTLTSGSDEEIDSVVETGNNATLDSGIDEEVSLPMVRTIKKSAPVLKSNVIAGTTATLLPGSAFNEAIKTLAGAYRPSTRTTNTSIKKIEKADTLPAGVTTKTISTTDSETPVLAWFDGGTIYYYTEADQIFMNQDASYMFYRLEGLISLDLSNFDTSNVTDMSYMFSNCSSLTSLDLSNFNTSNVTDMSYMFSNCSSLTSLDLSSFDTSNVMDMSAMFSNCGSVTSIDLSSFDTSNVTDMSSMFSSCSSLTGINLSSFDTSNVTNMSSMFSSCFLLTSIDLSNFDTSKVMDMSYMFDSSDILETIYVSDKFVTNHVSVGYDMFRGAYSLVGGNGTKYDPNYTDYGYANIDTDQTPGYFTNRSGSTVIIRFFTNGGSEVDPQVVSKGGTIVAATTTKENALFKGWYIDEGLTRSFKTSTPINSNMKLYAKWECVQGYYNNKGQCIDNNKKIEQKGGIIKLTDGEKTVYIKDRNQGATQAKGSTIIHKFINPILKSVKKGENLSNGRIYRYATKELSEIFGEGMFTLGTLISRYANNGVNLIKDIKSKYEAGHYLDSFGNYYYWGNNTGVSYNNLGLGEISDSIVIPFNSSISEEEEIDLIKSLVKVNLSPEILSKGFTGGKIGEKNTGWEKGNTNNPCDSSKGEFLPTLQDWVDLMQIWGNINGYELVKTEQKVGENDFRGVIYVFGSGLENAINNGVDNPNELLQLLNLEMTEDIMVPGAGLVANVELLIKSLGELEGVSEEEIENTVNDMKNNLGIEYAHIPVLSPLWIASDSGDTVGISIGEFGLVSVTTNIGKLANSIAMPVRCFVDESAWSSNKKENHGNYSGGSSRGRSGGSSSLRLSKDHCPNGDFSDSYYDKTCGEDPKKEKNSDETHGSAEDIYEWAKDMGLTSMDSIERFQGNRFLTRAEMAKIVSIYLTKILGKKEVSNRKCEIFDDIQDIHSDLHEYIISACNLGIMGRTSDGNDVKKSFHPYYHVTKAEAVTIISRVFWGHTYKNIGEEKRYERHLNHLIELGVDDDQFVQDSFTRGNFYGIFRDLYLMHA